MRTESRGKPRPASAAGGYSANSQKGKIYKQDSQDAQMAQMGRTTVNVRQAPKSFLQTGSGNLGGSFGSNAGSQNAKPPASGVAKARVSAKKYPSMIDPQPQKTSQNFKYDFNPRASHEDDHPQVELVHDKARG